MNFMSDDFLLGWADVYCSVRVEVLALGNYQWKQQQNLGAQGE